MRDPLRPYRRWATGLFVLLGGVGLLGIALVLGSGFDLEPVIFALTVGPAAVGVVLFLATALGLGSSKPWAVHAVQPLGVVLIVGGMLRAVVGVLFGRIDFPLEALGAILVLTNDHRPDILPKLDLRGRRTVILVVAGLVVVQIVPVLGEPLRRGLLVGAPKEAHALTVTIPCDVPPTGVDPITARVAWSWATGEALSPSVDGVRIEWREWTGRVTVRQGAVSDPESISRGSGSEDAMVLVDVVGPGGFQSATYRVELTDGPEDGWIEFDVAPGFGAETTGQIQMQAWYAHGGRWVNESEVASCVW
jgi:hypothetical protein